MGKNSRAVKPKSPPDSTTATTTSSQQQPLPILSQLGLLVKLGRPKFLFYSLACHLVGVFVAQTQGRPIDWANVALLQLTIWFTHLMTHYVNDYGDYEADMLNNNAGSWTGGSKVLRTGLIERHTALLMGLGLMVLAIMAGAACVIRYTLLHAGVVLPSIWSLDSVAELILAVLHSVPWGFVLFGLSTFFVAWAYSLPPLRLSANALGEVCVSYVLTFTTPVVGCLLQQGQLSYGFVTLLLPLFLMNLNRMVIMNIPDREGDGKADKVTSVVLIGEDKAVQLNNLIYLWVYCLLLPQLPLSTTVRLAYYVPLPLRFWQSLRINVSNWWNDRALTDSIPFVESLYILVSVCCLNVGLMLDERDDIQAWLQAS
jgi:1,4-dihydroxy-2-naphthoate octaprenyltransferase